MLIFFVFIMLVVLHNISMLYWYRHLGYPNPKRLGRVLNKKIQHFSRRKYIGHFRFEKTMCYSNHFYLKIVPSLLKLEYLRLTTTVQLKQQRSFIYTKNI